MAVVECPRCRRRLSPPIGGWAPGVRCPSCGAAIADRSSEDLISLPQNADPPHDRIIIPEDDPLDAVAAHGLDPVLVRKIGAIRKVRRWLERDLTSFASGFCIQILLGILSLITLLVASAPRSIEAIFAIGLACLTLGVFTGLCMMLAAYVVEHGKAFRRLRLSYLVVLTVWLTLWALLAAGMDYDSRSQRLSMIPITGFATLPCAALVACIPLTILGAINSCWNRRERKSHGAAPVARSLK